MPPCSPRRWPRRSRRFYCQGLLQTLARYPNITAANPYLHVGAGSTANAISDASLSGDAGKWTGAQVRWRRWSWWWETRPITGDNGSGTLTLSATNGRGR